MDDADPFAGGVTEVGLVAQVMPLAPQAPERESAVAALNPFDEPTVTVEVGEPAMPAVVLKVVGFAEMLKLDVPPLPTCNVMVAD